MFIPDVSFFSLTPRAASSVALYSADSFCQLLLLLVYRSQAACIKHLLAIDGNMVSLITTRVFVCLWCLCVFVVTTCQDQPAWRRYRKSQNQKNYREVLYGDFQSSCPRVSVSCSRSRRWRTDRPVSVGSIHRPLVLRAPRVVIWATATDLRGIARP